MPPWLWIALGAWWYLQRRRSEERIDVTAPYLPPVAAPLRQVTPNGGWNAPRYLTAAGGTTGNRAKAADPNKVHHYHEAVDLQTTPGESVLAICDGTIVDVYTPGSAAGGYCLNGLKLQDAADPRRTIVYCDLAAAPTVQKGARVKRGDRIGTAGSFVHLAVKVGGTAHNPGLFVPFEGSQARI